MKTLLVRCLVGSCIAWLPVADAALVVDRDTTIAAEDRQFEGQDITVTGGTLTLEGDHAFGHGSVSPTARIVLLKGTVRAESFVLRGHAELVLAGGTVLEVRGPLTMLDEARLRVNSERTAGPLDGRWVGVGAMVRAVDLAIASGARITADGTGYPGGADRGRWGNGPGGGGPAGDLGLGGGAGHGGAGSRPIPRPQVAAGGAYGSPWAPVDLGSGGGGGGDDGSLGGSGGGAVHLVVEGRFVLEGAVTADGLPGAGSAGGGSGGSIWIETRRFEGGGALSAQGGGASKGGTGAGGRIAVAFQESTFATWDRVNIDGGPRAETGTGGRFDLTVPDHGLTVHRRYAVPEGARQTLGTIHVPTGSQLVLGARSRLTVADSLRLDPGGTLDCGGGSELRVTHSLELSGSDARVIARSLGIEGTVDGAWRGTGITLHAGQLVLSSGARISADGQGYLGGTPNGQRGIGPGGGGPGGDWGMGGGGGHGSRGASPPPRPQVQGGSEYGSARQPTDLGSGGGGVNSGNSYGGNGGGAILLRVDGTFTLDGLLSANGEPGQDSGGGGAGGSIWVEAGTLSGSGRLSATGGNADIGGGGSGGRVLVSYLRSTFPPHGHADVSGGTTAEAGTCAFVDRSIPGLGFTLEQRYAVPDGGNETYGKVHVLPGARWILGNHGRVTVEDSLTVAPEGRVEVGGGTWLGVTDRFELQGTNARVLVRSVEISEAVAGTWRGEGATLQAGDLIVPSGAHVSADEQGYVGGASRGQRGAGPGGGYNGGDLGQGGGGGHGGQGGRPLGRPQVPGGPAYGSPVSPLAPGSGGGGGGSDFTRGGAGGGAIHLVVAKEFRLDGLLSANGGDGSGNAGGGSGGSVLVQVGRLVGDGRLEALGGAGDAAGNLGGGGSGGRIALHTWDHVFLSPRQILVSPGSPAGADLGSLHLGSPGDDTVWSGLEQPILHDSHTLGWHALAVNPVGAESDLVLENDAAATRLARAPGTSGEHRWYTPAWPDGAYRFRLAFRAADGRIVHESERAFAIHNQASWHAGTLAASEPWTAGSLHLVEGELVVRSGVTLTLEPGAIVKCTRGSRIVLEPGAALDARGRTQSPVILTSAADDRIGGDTGHDGSRSLPRAGDWTLVLASGASFLRNEFTLLLHTRSTHAGTLDGIHRFDGGWVHEVTADLVLSSGATLVVDPGAVVKFHPRTGIVVPPGARLEARGTLAAPVVFTSIHDDSAGGDTHLDREATRPTAGDWRWIRVGGDLVLDHTHLRFGGGTPSGAWDGTGMVRVDSGATAVLRACRLEDALFDGVLGFGTVRIENTVLRGNDRGLAVHGATLHATHLTCVGNRLAIQIHGGTLELSNAILAHSTEAGILQDLASPTPRIQSCLFWNPAFTARNWAGIPDPTGANGNRIADPRLADAPLGDVRLTQGSPAIDAAHGPDATPLDARDAPRVDDPRSPDSGQPTASGAPADVGALEFVENATSDFDLVVTRVSGPATVIAGETATVRWTVANAGTAAIRQPWRDALRLVPAEGTSSLSPLEIAEIPRSDPIDPGASVEAEAKVTVPAGTEGLWRWSVRVNARGEVFEGRQTFDNVAVASTVTELRVPTLVAGDARRFTFQEAGIPSGFRFEVPAESAFRLELDADSTDGRCRLYAASGRMPTESDFDLATDDLASPDVRLSGLAGSGALAWYVLAIPESLPDGRLGATLALRRAEFGLREIGISRAGHRGSVTLPVSGEAFDSTLRVQVRAPDGRTFAATDTEVVDAAQARVRFVFEDAPLGFYDVIADQGGARRELPDVLQIVPSTIPGLSVEWSLPARARERRPFDLYLVYGNPGETDLPMPRLALECLDGTGEIWLPGEDESRFREPVLTLVRLQSRDPDDLPETDENDRAPAASLRSLASSSPEGSRRPSTGLEPAATGLAAAPRVLPPGTTQRLHLRAASTRGVSAVRFGASVGDDSDTDPVDWNGLHHAVVPPQPHPLWTNAWQAVVASAGTTRGQYHAALLAAEDRARTFGLDLRTEQELLTFLVREALERVITPRVSGRVILDDGSSNTLRRVVVLRPIPDSPSTPWHLAPCWYDGTFGIRDVPPGDYDVSVEDFLPSPLVRISVGNQPLTHLELHPRQPAARLEGTVHDGPGGPPVADFALVVRRSPEGRTHVRASDATGHFQFADLEGGSYEIRSADGSPLAGDSTRIQVQPGHTAIRSLLASPTQGSSPTSDASRAAAGAAISGVVHDAETGHPVANAYVAFDGPAATVPTRSGPDGRFSLPPAPAGADAIVGTARGYLEARLELSTASPDSPSRILRIAPRGTVDGVVRRQGMPVPGVPILLATDSSLFAETTTDASGRYEFSDLPESAFHLGIGTFTGPCLWTDDLDIGPGRRRIRRDPNLDLTSRVSGRCVAADGTTGLPLLVVSLVRNGEVLAQTTTDARGGFGFLVVQAGDYDIQASGSGIRLPTWHEMKVVTGVDRSDLLLVASTRRLSVRVTDDQGNALPDADVTLSPDEAPRDAGGGLWMRTGADGRATFERLPSGSYRARVILAGFVPTDSPVAIPAAGDKLDVVLGSGGVLRGTVSAEGARLSGVRLALVKPDGTPILTTSTVSDGTYRFDAVPETPLELWVLPEPPWTVAFLGLAPFANGTTQNLDVPLARGRSGVWAGSVRFSDGRLAPFATVQWVADNGIPFATTHASGERGFRLGDLPLERGALVAFLPGHPPARLSPATIDPSAREAIELVLPSAVAFPWDITPPESAATSEARLGLHGLGDVFAGRIGDFAAGEVWTEFFGGDYGVQPPQFYMDQQPTDLEAHLALYEEALERSKTTCSGVALGWDQCKAASTFAFRAERDWNDAYRAMRAMNSASSGLIVTRATVVALKAWKLGLGIGKFAKLLQAPETPADKALYDGLSVGLNADSFFASKLVRGEFDDWGGYLSGLGAAITIAQQYQMSEVAEKRLKFAGLVREAVSVGKDVLEGYAELQTLDQNNDQGLSAYLSAADNYFRALRQYREGLNRMKAGLADCRTGGGTQAGPPPADGLDSVASGSVPVVRSEDPNDKSSLTSGSGSFLRPGEPILYTIRFENVASASAPAQTVRITDALDTALDWASFQPVALGFNHVVLDLPAGVRHYTTVAPVATDPYPVHASVILDSRLGVVTWTFRSIDPVTGDLPEDPLAGFLPPNDATGSGEGFVSFSIRPRNPATDHLALTNRASIAFDVNAPILTPIVTNRIDATPPTSRLRQVRRERYAVELACDASDGNGSGVVRCDVFRSKNGGPFEAWLQAVPLSTVLLPADPGTEVSLYSIATDAAGNRESPESSPDLTLAFPPELVVASAVPTVLRWTSLPGRTYTIERAEALGPATGWVRTFGPVPGNGGIQEYSDPEARATAFYRLIQSGPGP